MSASTAELREIVSLLREVKDLLGEVELKSESITRRLNQEVTLLTATMALTRRMGLPDNMDDGIGRVQRLVASLNALRAALIATEAAAGPVGWALAGIGLAASFVSLTDLIESETRGR